MTMILFMDGNFDARILEKHHDLDKIYIPVGGGGLIAGCALAAKNLNRKIKIIELKQKTFLHYLILYIKKKI